MKGSALAGGSGTQQHRLTAVTAKLLLRVCDEPMDPLLAEHDDAR